MVTDVVYRITDKEDETDLEREVREKVGGELWEKWKGLQNSIERVRRGDAVAKWKAEQAIIETALNAMGWARGDVWDDYNEEAPYRRMMESKAQARDSDMMAYYDDPYDDDGFYPEDD